MVYTYNYYQQYATPKHPYDKQKLIKEAATTPHTCRDANGHLVYDRDGKEEEIISDIPKESYAFCEHTGQGIGGKRGDPFYNYWYDDNVLARNMSKAYGKPQVRGLFPYRTFIRWSVIGDDLSNYKVYGNNHIDCLALDGIYFYRIGDFGKSYGKLKTILDIAKPELEPNNQRFKYHFADTYYYGLSAILAGILMDCFYLDSQKTRFAMQHYASLRSQILSRQLYENGVLKGWLSGDDPNNLINTETVSANVLGLAAGVDLCFEAGKPPLTYSKESNFFLRDHNVLSAAVEGGSKPGFMSLGPNIIFAGGHKYSVHYFARAKNHKACNAEVSVLNVTKNEIIAKSPIIFNDGSIGLNWTKVQLEFNLLQNAELSFRCYWHGGSTIESNMDLAFIRIKGT